MLMAIQWNYVSRASQFIPLRHMAQITDVQCYAQTSFHNFASMFGVFKCWIFQRNINIYLHFMSFLHIDMAQVVEIIPQIRQGPTHTT